MSQIQIANPTAPSHQLLCEDVLSGLDSLISNQYKLVVSSPPYNIGKSYERDSTRSLDQYIEWQFEIIKKISNLVDERGSVCWQVGNFIRNNEYIPLDIVFHKIFTDIGFKLRNRIIWRFNFGLNADKRFSGRYETLLWFTKSDNYTFNLDPVRIPQLYPGKRHVAKKGPTKAGMPSGNPLGKNPSDYWEFSAERDFKENPVWDLPNVKARHPEKTEHPCQFPIELAERCILAFTNAGDRILDPFVGTGASLIAAKKHGRNSVGIDKDQNFLVIAAERLAAFDAGVLPMRPSGKPVIRPNPKDRVARVPAEWLSKVI